MLEVTSDTRDYMSKRSMVSVQENVVSRVKISINFR